MQIGEVIRTYRKEKGITQEEMANRLGVTAPAVNKWEKGNSLPDIGLLAPIARLLGISLETLLSFHEELSLDEINRIIWELDAKLEEEEYGEVFLWAEDILHKYPNCNQLIWRVTIVLDARRQTDDIADADKYGETLGTYYETVLADDDPVMKKQAADSLFGFYVRKKEYDRAERYLQYFSEDDPQKKLKQAQIYKYKGMTEDADRAYEQILFSGYQVLNQALSMLYLSSMEKKDYERAKRYLDKDSELAKIFEMGRYHEISGYLDLAAAKKDAEETVRIVKELISSIETMGAFTGSFLYEHLGHKPMEQKFYDRVKRQLLDLLREKDDFDYMKDCDEWERLLADFSDGV